VSSGLSSNLDTKNPDSVGAELLSIALIGPDENRRRAVATALAECRAAKVREFSSYPTALDEVPRLLEQYFDVILIDLDSNPEFALELVESICAKDAATVMVYSSVADQDLVVRCMRAGAREYLIPPYDQSNVGEALALAAAILRPRARNVKRSLGRMLVFLGAKGGAGVTTIACNFAIALAQESGQSTLLIDLALPMGDAALNLGIAAEYSTDHALQDPERLDPSFLLKLLAKHQSGVSLLAAPSKVPEVDASKEAIDKLMSVARSEFDNVVVDLGSRIDLMNTSLFREANTIYLVTQAGISELRNANRLISRFFDAGGPKLEVVINRFEPSFLGVTEEVITKAISRPVRWKIPDDYDATRQMQNSSGSISLADSPISRLILEMASSVTGVPVPQEKSRKGFSLKGLGKSITDKMATPEKPASVVGPSSNGVGNGTGASVSAAASGVEASVDWPTPEDVPYGTALGATQLNATATVPGAFVYTPGPGYKLPAGTHTLWVTFTPDGAVGDEPLQTSVSITVAKAAPAITWPEPAAIPSGAALGVTQLNATSSVKGTFEYSPAAGEVLPAGSHALTVTFTPTNSANYSTAQVSVTINVLKIMPVVSWRAPDPIQCGQPLNESQLNASCTVPGNFTYSPAPGEVLPSGMHTLNVTFTPSDSTNCTTAEASVTIMVLKATPVLNWPAPEPLTYGTALSAAQLNASASVSGSYVYTPAEGTELAVGEHTPSVIFTPDDIANYMPAQAATSLIVVKAAPTITWHAPSPIPCGTALGEEQLHASAPIPGKFEYSPAAGQTLQAGEHTLTVTFTPDDTFNYTPANASVQLEVYETAPTAITWCNPPMIAYGTPLSEAELNASASAPGTLAYAPPVGNVLAPGTHTLKVRFTPADGRKDSTAEASVEIIVESLPNIDELLAAAMPTALPHSGNPRSKNSAPADRNTGSSGSATAAKVQRETRTYKGAVYEKGDDGQWHLQQK
jgi:Flp pilus assembly CpaE family ATPase